MSRQRHVVFSSVDRAIFENIACWWREGTQNATAYIYIYIYIFVEKLLKPCWNKNRNNDQPATREIVHCLWQRAPADWCKSDYFFFMIGWLFFLFFIERSPRLMFRLWMSELVFNNGKGTTRCCGGVTVSPAIAVELLWLLLLWETRSLMLAFSLFVAVGFLCACFFFRSWCRFDVIFLFSVRRSSFLGFFVFVSFFSFFDAIAVR